MENMSIHFSDDFNQLITEIAALGDFKKVCYYIRSMKQPPHNGIFKVNTANTFIFGYAEFTSFYSFFTPCAKIPYPIKELSNVIIELIKKHNIDEEEILLYTFGFDSLNKNDVIFGEKLYGDKFYVAYSGKILYPHANIDHELVLNDVMSGKKRFKDYFSVDQSRMIYAFICILIVYNCCPYNDLEDILALEDLVEGHDKYGLTDVTSAQFLRQGLLIDNKYYLYNILFDTSIASPHDSFPHTIKVIQDYPIRDLSIRMRCDNSLCVDKDRMVSTAGVGFEKWRGIDFHANEVENSLIKGKEIIVYYDPETMNKLLLIIKSESNEDGEIFYQFSIEELWSMSRIISSHTKVITNYIHGCYYPDRKTFDHIDFSVNQYNIETYEKKYNDSVTDTKVPIEKYGDVHYKIWCITGENLNWELWAKLVFCTVDFPFRKLFMEIIGGEIISIE